MKFKISALLFAIAPLAFAQGVLTFPDRLYYKFNEGAGNEVVNYAIPGGSTWQPTRENASNLQWDNATPILGGSAWMPAGLNRLLSGAPTPLNVSYTIECWFKANAPFVAGNLQRVWGDYSVATFRCYVGFYGPGSYYLGGNAGVAGSLTNPALCGGCTTAQGSAGATAMVYDGNWHHLALVYDQPTATITSYVDGLVDMTKTGAAVGGTGTNFMLGGVVGAGSPTNGTIDEFRFWGEARSQTQIQAGMSMELVPATTTAAFYATKRTGNAPLLTNFKNISTTPVPGGIVSYAWDFENDGIIDSTAPNPCFVYTTPGLYSVALTVTDALAGVHTVVLNNYVNVGAAGFTLATCGQGDILIAAPPAPIGWAEGFTLVTFDTAAPKGTGLFFGINPDNFTIFGVTVAAGPGNPFHFLNVGIPTLYPDAPFTSPAGAVSGLVGLTMDAVVVYRDSVGTIMNWTNVARVTF